MNTQPYSLMQVYGIEIEYMIVEQKSLEIAPLTDRVLFDAAGEYVMEVERGSTAWSNELALHVIELKTNGPSPTLTNLGDAFHQQVMEINKILTTYDACLLPGAMHPWMDPLTQTRLWLHDDREIYDALDKVFNCKGHGWSNLQSVHINLPFANDQEFARLHAAIRLLLPLVATIAASSPVMDAKLTGLLDNRLRVYTDNARAFPCVTGQVIPEPVYSEQDYNDVVYRPITELLKQHSVEDVLDPVWVNSRGAIARFDRGSIEIRLMDTQECPNADLAVVELICYLIRELLKETWSTCEQQKLIDSKGLVELLSQSIRTGEQTVVDNRQFLECFGIKQSSLTARDFWEKIITRHTHENSAAPAVWQRHWELYLRQGTLGRRIVNDLPSCDKQSLTHTYSKLAECLATNAYFHND